LTLSNWRLFNIFWNCQNLYLFSTSNWLQ